MFGCGHERLGDATSSATTLRRRRTEWSRLGLFDRLRLAVLDAYEQMIGLVLDVLCVDTNRHRAPRYDVGKSVTRAATTRTDQVTG